MNNTNCSDYTAPVAVVVASSLSNVADQPLVQPSVPPLNYLGTLPGTPSVEGGAASYHIPIEVPPGRAGMQPELSLNYSSRNGSGIAGVGWSVSGTSSIYRCPKTLSQENGGRPVIHDGQDKLCFDGQRLVASSLSSYGTLNSEYRTEVDQFDRIKLNGGNIYSGNSYFVVEHKSGRVSRFIAVFQPSDVAPDVWYLDKEWDRQGNCIGYEYTMGGVRWGHPERLLSRIRYTGTGAWDSGTCNFGNDARSVNFNYVNRPDWKRSPRSAG